MFEFKQINIKDENDWNSRVGNYSDHNLFHLYSWNEIIEKTYNTKKVLFKILKNGQEIGLISGHFQKRGPFKLFGSPLKQTATHFMGPLFKEKENFVEILDALWFYLKKNFEINYFEITLGKALTDKDFSGWNKNLPTTFIVDLNKTKEQLWQDFEKRARTAARKALKNNIQIKKTNKPSGVEVKLFYKMLELVYGRSGIKPVFPFDFYKNLFSSKKTFAWLYKAMYKDKIVAMALILQYSHWMNYHSAGSLREYNKLGINNLLQWQIMKDGIDSGIKEYDMGAGSGIKSLDKFKLSFSPREENYLNLWKATKFASLARWGYQKLLPLFRKLS